jgi:predicted N-acyltransferase
MKKTFPLAIEGKNRDRVLEAVKHEVRKYVRRERRRALPDGVDFWDFDCRFGPAEAEAVVVHFATLTELMDAVAKAGGNQFFVEILASHGRRQHRPASQSQD